MNWIYFSLLLALTASYVVTKPVLRKHRSKKIIREIGNYPHSVYAADSPYLKHSGEEDYPSETELRGDFGKKVPTHKPKNLGEGKKFSEAIKKVHSKRIGKSIDFSPENCTAVADNVNAAILQEDTVRNNPADADQKSSRDLKSLENITTAPLTTLKQELETTTLPYYEKNVDSNDGSDQIGEIKDLLRISDTINSNIMKVELGTRGGKAIFEDQGHSKTQEAQLASTSEPTTTDSLFGHSIDVTQIDEFAKVTIGPNVPQTEGIMQVELLPVPAALTEDNLKLYDTASTELANESETAQRSDFSVGIEVPDDSQYEQVTQITDNEGMEEEKANEMTEGLEDVLDALKFIEEQPLPVASKVTQNEEVSELVDGNREEKAVKSADRTEDVVLLEVSQVKEDEKEEDVVDKINVAVITDSAHATNEAEANDREQKALIAEVSQGLERMQAQIVSTPVKVSSVEEDSTEIVKTPVISKIEEVPSVRGNVKFLDNVDVQKSVTPEEKYSTGIGMGAALTPNGDGGSDGFFTLYSSVPVRANTDEYTNGETDVKPKVSAEEVNGLAKESEREMENQSERAPKSDYSLPVETFVANNNLQLVNEGGFYRTNDAYVGVDLTDGTSGQDFGPYSIQESSLFTNQVYPSNEGQSGNTEGQEPVSYVYRYKVNDPFTKDIKSHEEARDGDFTTGTYSLHEPDGTIRTVEYHVNGESGFQVLVKTEDHSVHQPAHQVLRRQYAYY